MAGLVSRHRPHDPLPRGRRPQPAHPPPTDLLPVRGAGRRTDDVAAGGARGCPQLGLPLRLATRRQHRHRRLPRSRQARRGPRIHGLAAQRHPPRPSTAPCPAHPARQAPKIRTCARRLAGLCRQPSRPLGQRRSRPAPARRLRVGSGRGLANERSGLPPVRRDVAHHGRFRRPSGGPLARARCRHLGSALRHRAPRAFQADGLARPGPGTDHRRTPPDVGCAHQTVACRTGGAARGRRTAWLRRGKGHLHAQLRLVRHRRCPVDPAAAGVPPGRLRTRPGDHRRGHPRPRGRIAVALPLPARTRRAARHRGRLPAVLVLARPGPRAQRTRARSGRTVPRAPRSWPAPSGCTPRRWTPQPVSTWATTRRP